MNNTYTLWQLLKEQKMLITVPMIQRDYAQGRRGKEYIRATFLQNIYDCLLQGKISELTLDFVYGNTAKQKFFPLDGQQRLTTLWLVHLYLAFRLEYLKNEEVKDALKRFRYQTRSSSSDFCERLCDEMAKTNPNDVGNITEYVKKQAWFFADWTQYPTINAMLRTLGGDQEKQRINSESNNDVKKQDADMAHIEAIFGNLEKHQLEKCWGNLTENKKITFELMIIGTEQLPISDDLYIKMNARGKKLTDFENFKADWIKDMRNNPDLTEKDGDKTYVQKYTEKLDQEWTDVFWNSRISSNPKNFDGNIDSMFFSFINRFVLNQLCLENVNASYYNSSKHIATDDEIKTLQKNFDFLYGTGLGRKKKSNDDSMIEYKGYEPYRKFLGKDNLRVLDKIFTNLCETELKNLSFSGLEEDEETNESSHSEILCHFLPQYSEDAGLVATTLKERIYFHAMCLFLEKPNWDYLEDWKRVVQNLVENAAIENLDAMIGCLREIDGLGKLLREKDWKIYDHLHEYTMGSSNSQLADQWNEERVKAKKIHEEPSWKEDILAAEKHAFFRGTIRFLYTDSDGKINWNDFRTKFRNAQNLFPSNTVGWKTIENFLGGFSSFEELNTASDGESYFFTTIGFHARNRCWKKNILCNSKSDMVKKVHYFLLQTNNSSTKDDIYEKFLKSNAVQVLSKRGCNHKYRYHNSKGWGILRDSHSTEGIFVEKTHLSRNKLLLTLSKAKKIQFKDNTIDLKRKFLWGKKIYFIYKDKEYCWFTDWDSRNWIRLDKNKEHCFEWTDEMNENSFLPALENFFK